MRLIECLTMEPNALVMRLKDVQFDTLTEWHSTLSAAPTSPTIQRHLATLLERADAPGGPHLPARVAASSDRASRLIAAELGRR